jgi:hypothetical protein
VNDVGGLTAQPPLFLFPRNLEGSRFDHKSMLETGAKTLRQA